MTSDGLDARAQLMGEREAKCPRCSRWVSESECSIQATGDGRTSPMGLAPHCPDCRAMLDARTERERG